MTSVDVSGELARLGGACDRAARTAPRGGAELDAAIREIHPDGAARTTPRKAHLGGEVHSKCLASSAVA